MRVFVVRGLGGCCRRFVLAFSSLDGFSFFVSDFLCPDSNGCEIDAAGVHSPLRDDDEEGLCKIPPPVAMICNRPSLTSSALLVCPCT